MEESEGKGNKALFLQRPCPNPLKDGFLQLSTATPSASGEIGTVGQVMSFAFLLTFQANV